MSISNIKSEALALECSKKCFLKNSVKLTEYNPVLGLSYVKKIT